MRRSKFLFDPVADPIAGDVIAAYENAEKARRSTYECYQAAVRVWRVAHPDHTLEYASQQAVEVVLKIKARLRVEE